MHPDDAKARDIKHGDIVKLYNDRASVLLIAQVTERVRPGVVHSYEGGVQVRPAGAGQGREHRQGRCA